MFAEFRGGQGQTPGGRNVKSCRYPAMIPAVKEAWKYVIKFLVCR